MTPRLACLVLLVACALAGCGADTPGASPPSGQAGHWKHCRVRGLAGAAGLTVYGDDLIAVAGGGDRAVYTFAIEDLEHGKSIRARKLTVTVRAEAALLGAEPFGLQGYRLEHLWALPVDFEGVAAQAPDFLFVGERTHRVVYWGRLVEDAGGRLSSLKLRNVSIAPGADRSKVNAGDWRDHGPGLAGLLALSGRRRVADVYVLDRAPRGGSALRVHRMDRYGSMLGSIPVKHDLGDALTCNALSWDGARYVIHYGRGRGRLATMKEPDAMRSTKLNVGTPGPAVEGVELWGGMTHGKDGTVYLVSSGDPAVVAWRGP